MRKSLVSILQYVIFLGGGLLLVWWQLHGMTDNERTEFRNAFKYANYWLVIPVVVMSILSHISRSMRWKLLMEPLGYKPKLSNVFAVTMVGYLANAAVPRLGEILKCTFLGRYEKLKVDKLVGTILVERTFDLICYLIFIGLTVLIQFRLIGDYARKEFGVLTSATGMPVWLKLLLIVAGIVAFLKIIHLLMLKYPQNRIFLKMDNFFKGIGQGFAAIRRLKHRKLFLVHTIFIWSMYLLQIYIGFYAMEGTSHLGFKAAFAVLSLATLAMIATPGGIGSFPLFVMETLLIYGISSPMGKAFGWLLWGVSTGIVIVAGLICLLLLPYLNKKYHPVENPDDVVDGEKEKLVIELAQKEHDESDARNIS
jgi:uncharacterized protein (TIRG00374 family)